MLCGADHTLILSVALLLLLVKYVRIASIIGLEYCNNNSTLYLLIYQTSNYLATILTTLLTIQRAVSRCVEGPSTGGTRLEYYYVYSR
jgi:hypothetical protein